MQNNELKVVVGSCPALARHSRDVYAQAAEHSSGSGAVDAVVQDLLGDFDRVPLDSNSSFTDNDESGQSVLGTHDHECSPKEEEADLHISKVEPRACLATWRTGAMHASALPSTVLSMRPGVGCASFRHGRGAAHAAARPAFHAHSAKPVSQLFPNSNHARDEEASFRVSVLLCSARLHDSLFGTRVLDPTLDMVSHGPRLGKPPPETSAGSSVLKKALESLQIRTELLTLHHATADPRAWTAREELFCLDDDVKVLRPITQHLGSWSGGQALDSIMFVIRNFQRTFATRLGDITSKALEHDSSSEYDQLVVASRITTQLAKDRHCLEDTRTLTSIRHKLLGSPGLMFHLEHAAKSALESELLFKALKMCDTAQEVTECMTAFQWYGGYQAAALSSIDGRREAFHSVLGYVLLQLAVCESQHTAQDAAARVLRVAGAVRALSEEMCEGAPRMHPGAEAHLLKYIMIASPNLLIRLAAQGGSTGGVFSNASFAVLSKVALALKRIRWRWFGTETLDNAATGLAKRLEARLRLDLKSANAAQVADAVQAMCNILALEDPGAVSREMRRLMATFQQHFRSTTTDQSNEITSELFLNLLRGLNARKLRMRPIAGKIEVMLQQQMRLCMSLEVQRRRKYLACWAGREVLIHAESVRQQVQHALEDASAGYDGREGVKESGLCHDPDDGGGVQPFDKEKHEAWLKRNRWSSKQAVLIGYECLYANIMSEASLHKLMRLIVQQRLGGTIGWRLISRCLRLANKRGLRGPKGRKTSQEYTQCLELLVDAHACEGELLHTDMVEQLSALNALLLERVSSSLLSHAAAARVGQRFAQTPPDAIQSGSDGGSTMIPATLEGCSRAVVPALLLQSLARSFDRYTGRPDPKEAKEFLDMMKLTSPATLSGYMQSVIRITGPEDVKNSPNAQRVRAAMISVASNIIPLYDCIDAQTHGAGGRHCEHRKDLLSNIQRIFYHSYDTVKHMVRSSAQLQFMDPDPGPGPPQQSPRSDVSSDSTEAEESPSRVRAAKGRQKWDNSGFECTDSENERRCVYYSQGQLWPLVQLAIADKTIKLKAGSVTTMSIMRAALPLVLKSSNIRHISPIVTCMQRYQYQNTALYDHVMQLITASYYQLREKHGGGAAYASIASGQPVESDEDETSPPPAPPPGAQHPAQQAHGRLSHSFVLKDTMQKMHAWLVCRALRSSYLPGKPIIDIMAERVQRLSDKRVTMKTVERYVGMYLDGLPATDETLRALDAAFQQRKQRWRDFAVASALQLFAERNFRSPVFEKEAVRWFEGQIARAAHRSGSGGAPLRPSLVGALRRIRQLWLLHGHDGFPQYSDALQSAIREVPVIVRNGQLLHCLKGGKHQPVDAVQSTTPSPVQLDIFRAVAGVYPSAALEQPACYGQLYVDIALCDEPAWSDALKSKSAIPALTPLKVAIECDGPHHFFINTTPHEQNLKTKLRNAMLEMDGWHVVLLDTYTWQSTTWHPDSATRKEVRRQFVVELLKDVPGLERLLPAARET